ncbi:NMT1-like family protein, partial [Vibrio parahaemolyticus EKP-021]
SMGRKEPQHAHSCRESPDSSGTLVG